MNRRTTLATVTAALGLLVGACTPAGPPPVQTSPATGYSVVVHPSTYAAQFILCNSPGAVVEVTLSGLNIDNYGITVWTSTLDGTALDIEYGVGPDNAPTFVAPPLDPLPNGGCFSVHMSTEIVNQGDTPSHFSYLATW